MNTTKSQQGSALVIVMVLVVVALLGGVGYMWYTNQPKASDSDTKKETTFKPKTEKISAEAATYTSEGGVKIMLSNPLKDQLVESPITVTGQVPGSWSFEGVFMLGLLDANNLIVANAQAKLDGNWQTEELESFSATLKYDKVPATDTGFLMLIKSNPSGLTENDDKIRIPIKFSE